MITIFNRKELLITYSLKIQAKVRDILAANRIDYVVNPIISLWQPTSNAEYKIYVKKTDYEKASWLIRDVFRQ